jgi:uncharacterized protein YbaR (Trm112 family)/SAM-dependent methyltransferase
MNWFYKHYRFATVPKGAVLDIGSGSNPFWRANILMERFLEDDNQRPGKLIHDRPLVCGDIHDMPFVDDAFSFIHCSHILEHLEYPEKAIGEMTRVARAGYIETPSEIHEFLDLEFPFHRWAISSEDGVMVFREKPQSIPAHPLIEALKKRNNSTWKFIRKHHSEMNILYWYWKKEVKYKIERVDRPIGPYIRDEQLCSKSKYVVKPWKSKLKLKLGKLLSQKVNLYKILACPACKIQIKVENSNLICTNCNKRYPIINNIPMMIEENSTEI